MLSRLLRGRAGTEDAIAGHQAGESFCLIQRDSLQPVVLPAWMAGATVTAADRSGAIAATLASAKALRPFAPVNVAAAIDGSGDLALNWIRRSRSGWAWLDQVDVPIGEAREQYRVNVTGPAGEIEMNCDAPNVSIAAADLQAVGVGPATIEVRQIGDWAASAPARTTINLQEQTP